MKPISQWLEEAKKQGYEWAEAAIRNYDPNFTTLKERISLRDALSGAFAWDKSPEGKDFWLDVFESLRDTTPVTQPSIECLIEDLGKLNSAIGNLEYNDTLKEPYRTQVYEATKASYEEQLAETKAKIAKSLGIEPTKERKLIGWVAANTLGKAYLVQKPEKHKAGWDITKPITPEQAIALCGRLPEWGDDEPIPVYEK